jgi:hypothetical protein
MLKAVEIHKYFSPVGKMENFVTLKRMVQSGAASIHHFYLRSTVADQERA